MDGERGDGMGVDAWDSNWTAGAQSSKLKLPIPVALCFENSLAAYS